MIFLYILGGIAMATLLFANFAGGPGPKAAERPRPPRCERRTDIMGETDSLDPNSRNGMRIVKGVSAVELQIGDSDFRRPRAHASIPSIMAV